jgi:hypothetical protein
LSVRLRSTKHASVKTPFPAGNFINQKTNEGKRLISS